MILDMSQHTYPSSMFLCGRSTFSADISDLGHDPFGRIYDDACDYGLAIRSDKTGNVVRFAVGSPEYDAENEIRCWTLVPITEDLRRNPLLTNWKVVLFND